MRLTHHSLLKLLHCAICLQLVQGHGRLIEPPSRSSMWRFGFDTPKNYDDAQLFCGGVDVQYSPEVGGKCGACGDPYFGLREHEVGGKYATGTIARKYDVGQVIDVVVDLTANHMGYFEFRLCQKDDPRKRVTLECLNKHLLKVDSDGSTRFEIKFVQYGTKVDLKLRLPKGVRCKACVLQWKYNAGNSWGTDPDGTSCIGCGNQEQFYGCADVAIGYDDLPEVKLETKPLCAYKKIHDEEWKIVCAGEEMLKTESVGSGKGNDKVNGKGNEGDNNVPNDCFDSNVQPDAAERNQPLMFLCYFLSTLLVVFQNLIAEDY